MNYKLFFTAGSKHLVPFSRNINTSACSCAIDQDTPPLSTNQGCFRPPSSTCHVATGIMYSKKAVITVSRAVVHAFVMTEVGGANIWHQSRWAELTIGVRAAWCIISKHARNICQNRHHWHFDAFYIGVLSIYIGGYIPMLHGLPWKLMTQFVHISQVNKFTTMSFSSSRQISCENQWMKHNSLQSLCLPFWNTKEWKGTTCNSILLHRNLNSLS